MKGADEFVEDPAALGFREDDSNAPSMVSRHQADGLSAKVLKSAALADHVLFGRLDADPARSTAL